MITIFGDAPFSDLKLQRRGNHGESEIDGAVTFDRGREARLPGSPPSEPHVRFSRIRLSSQ